MNTDPKKSAQPCGCDEGANHLCQMHTDEIVDSLDEFFEEAKEEEEKEQEDEIDPGKS